MVTGAPQAELRAYRQPLAASDPAHGGQRQ